MVVLRVLVKDAVNGFSDSDVDSLLMSLNLKCSGSRVKKLVVIQDKLDVISDSQLLRLKKMFNIEG